MTEVDPDELRLSVRAWYRAHHKLPATHTTPNLGGVVRAVRELIEAGRVQIKDGELLCDDGALYGLPGPNMRLTWRPGGRTVTEVGSPPVPIGIPALDDVAKQELIWTASRGTRGLSPVEAEREVHRIVAEHAPADKGTDALYATTANTGLLPARPDGVLIRIPAFSSAGYLYTEADGMRGKHLTVDGVEGLITQATPANLGDAIDLIVQFPAELRFEGR